MRNILDEAIGASPATTVDIDAVVEAGRRRVARRRLAVAGAGIGVAVVTGVVGALALATVGTPAPGPPSRPDLGLGSPPAPDGSAPVRGDETVEQTTQRLAGALADGLTAALPEVRISDGPTGRPGVRIYHDPGASLVRYDSDTVITTATGENEIFFESWPGGAIAGPNQATTPPAPPIAVDWIESCAGVPAPYEECEESVGPDGQTIVVLSERFRGGAQGDPGAGGPGAAPVGGGAVGEVAFQHVYVTWTNAKVHLTIASDTKRGEPDAVAAPLLLTRQQLTAIAIDPDLTVTA